MLIRRATLLDGRKVDVRVERQITEIAPDLRGLPGEEVLDARWGTVLPGLHDHHLHLRAAAAAADSVHVGPPTVRTTADFERALATARPDRDGWIRAIGYHESVAGSLDRSRLDALVSAPLRVQHRSGAMWILNTAALTRVGASQHPDGRLRSSDPSWAAPPREPDLGALSHRLSAFGVSGVTDATPDLTTEDRDHMAGSIRQRLHCLAPGKKILHDDRLDLDDLTAWIADRRRQGVPVAVHCVTAAQLTITLAALRETGCQPSDRIEHAAMVPPDSLADLAALGVTVVTQPNFVTERGTQYLADIPAEELPELWRLASLIRAGVPVAAGTDAPFGAPDPWAAMRSAVMRATEAGEVLSPAERVSPGQALSLFLGRHDRPAEPRQIALGHPADLCVLTVPPEEALRELASDMVTATVIDGRLVTPGAGTPGPSRSSRWR